MEREFEQTVESLPTGIMTCFINNEEVGIMDFSPFHIKIRVPEKFSEEIKTIKIIYYSQDERLYKYLELEKFSLCEPEEKEFWWEYDVIIEDDTYREMVFFVMKQYYEYIVMKSESYDNSFSKKLIGYPSEKDIFFDEDFASWRNRQIQEIEKKNLVGKMFSLDIEVAISLENPESYEMFLNESESSDTESKNESDQKLIKQIMEKAARLYIGNQFCHNLFPEKEIMFQLMEKVSEKQKKITLVFTYLREELLKKTENLLEEIYQWSKNKDVPLEILINDFGMLSMVGGKEDYFSICYGTLLNKRRKDPRYQYKNSSEEEWKCLEENSLNVKEYRDFLIEQGITRLEYESSGYPLKLPDIICDEYKTHLDAFEKKNGLEVSSQKKNMHGQGISMHLPLYQTNTSQFCTLHAICKNQDRGKQEFIQNCPKYCGSYVCMYPQHLEMIGRYNSLFAMDRYLLEHPDILDNYKEAGMDRIVWNLI